MARPVVGATLRSSRDRTIPSRWSTGSWPAAGPSSCPRGVGAAARKAPTTRASRPTVHRVYSCEPALSLPGADRALRDIDAITPVILAQPFVDRSRVAIGGQSRGGILAVAWSGRQPDIPRAVVNFVGGWLSSRCWSRDEVNQSLFKRGVPYGRSTIWLYGDKDPYYPLRHSRDNFAAFEAAGGKGELSARRRRD